METPTSATSTSSSSSADRQAETDVDGHQEIFGMFGDSHGDHKIKTMLTQINRRYNIDELFPIFLDYQQCVPPKTISPSCFMREMQLTTDERFQSLTYSLRKHYPRLSGFPQREPKAFKPSPSIIIFQNCEIGQIYSITLSVRNIVAVIKGIRMHSEFSPIFTVVQNSHIVYSKVAPGMTVNFTVTFKPLDKFEDCSHRIAFETDEESFIIPIIALGPRPLLDFPDRVEIPTSMVKILTSKLLFVRNVGILPAVFTITTNSELFSVDPAKGVIGPKDTMQVAIRFVSQVVGAFQGNLTIRYETGEELFVTVHATAENGDIGLDETYVSFESTFMGLQRQQSITLHNNTDHIIKYSWKRFSIPEEENKEIQKLKESFQEMKEFEQTKTTMLEWFEIIGSEANKLVYDRIYDEEVSTLKDEEFPFRAPVFSISPLMGEVWPNGSMSMYITFEPERMDHYAAEAFCEVTGREDRLQINIEGIGKGPRMELNVNMLNIDYIFLCSRHSYEIVVQNMGDIPGRVNFKPKECVFGGRAHCSPHHLNIMPGEHKTFVLSFSSNCQGYFFETIDFVIHESNEIISCLMKGKVISPTLHFNMNLLDFKEIPIGFICNRYVILSNSSMVPVNFTLRVMYDGNIPSISHKAFANLPVKGPLPIHPKEFKITPSDGVVTAYSWVKIHLALTPNMVRCNSTALIVDMWDSKAKSVSLPLKFIAKCPRIVCSPKEIVIRFCFINYPYTRVVTFENHSNLPGFFYIVPQNSALPSPMTFTTPIMQGIIKPKSNIAIPLTIMTNELGKHVVNINVMMMGEVTPQQLCKLMCTGQGPVISVTSFSLHWEETEVLKTKVMVVNLTNDSPIPATYTPMILNSPSPWSVETESGVLYAEETIALEVSLYLTDTGTYSGTLEVNVENSRTITIELTAIGIGTSIVLDPPMCPEYNLGSVFRHQLIRREILVTNKGQKHHQLIWNSLADENITKRRKPPDPKVIVKPPIFQMKPLKMMLKGGESTTLIIEGQCEELRSYEDTFFCRAIIEKRGKKKIILQSTIKVLFIDPMIKWNMDKVLFRADYKPGAKVFKILKQKVFLTNMAADLPITVTLETDYPFLIDIDDQCKDAQLGSITLHMEGQSSVEITVLFDPSHQTASRREICSGEIVLSYRDHPQTDSIPISAEVNFPNVKVQPSILDFGCTVMGGEASKQVLLINTSPLTVNYWWFWKQETIHAKFQSPFIMAEHIEAISSETLLSSDSEIGRNGSLDDFMAKSCLKGRSKEGSSIIMPAGIQFSIDKMQRNESSGKTSMGSSFKVHVDPALRRNASKIRNPSFNSKSALISSALKDSSSKYQSDTGHLTTFGCPSVEDFSIQDGHKAINVKDLESNHSLSEEFIELRNRCWPLFQGFREANWSIPLLKKLPMKQDMLPIDEVFQVTPSFGRLKPFESQLVTVSFNGRSCVSAEVSALCCVEGGPTESVSLIGFSGSSGYIIDRTHINFGRRMFCEISEEALIIHNSGNMTIDFMANTMEVPDDMKSVHQKGSLIVVPKSGTLKADYGTKITVNYFPGIPGWFTKSFELEIGFDHPEIITIEGYAVIPQLYVWLPRPVRLVESNPEEYIVIAEMQRTLIQKKPHSHKHIKYKHQIEYLVISETERNILDQDNWVIVSYSDEFPTVAEIELAIERSQAYFHICNNPFVVSKFRTNAKNQPKTDSIPGLTAMTYLMDFGMVVINTAVSFSAILENLGSIPVEAKIPPAEKSECERGMCINFRDVRLAPGETSSIHLTFQPTIEDYPLTRQELIRTINVWVTNGAKIPFEVRATVILPFVTLSATTVNFEQVLCSHCKMIRICVANKGWADCMWSAQLAGEHTRSINSAVVNREKKREADSRALLLNSFTIRESSGMLKPGSHTYLEIFFKPLVNGIHKTTIDVVVDHNPEVLKIKLIGEGLLPNLILSRENIVFDSCLPYPEQNNEMFTVENPCSFPIEFFFPDSDSQIEHEDQILRVIFHYYNTNELLIPIRKPGDLLPKELYDFYQLMIEEINFKLLQDHLKREQSSSITKLQSFSETDKVYKASKKRSGAGREKPMKMSPSTFSYPSSKECLQSIFDKSQTTQETIDDKTPDIIEAAIHDHINEIQLAYNFETTHYMDHDPIKVCLHNSLDPPPPIDITIPKSGVLIVFHGAPNTDYLLAAHRAARALSLAVINIDQILLDTIVSSDSPNALKAKRLINQAYNEQLGISLLDEGASETYIMSGFELFYIMKDKVDSLYLHSIAKKEKPSKKGSKNKSGDKTPQGSSEKSSGKKPSTKSSKGSNKSSKPDQGTGILGDLPPDLVIELFKERLQMADCLEGAIVDGLNSIFLKNNASHAITLLLKAVGNIKFIQFITFFNSFATHVNTLMKEKAEKDKRAVEEMEAKVAYLESLSDDELLPEEDKVLYRELKQKMRKAKQMQRREQELARQKRISDKAEKGKGDKKSPQNQFQLKINTSITSDKKTAKPKSGLKSTTPASNTTSTSESPPKDKKGPKSAFSELQSKFQCYQNEYDELLLMLEYWDRVIMEVVGLPPPVAKPSKKGLGKKGKKSVPETSAPAEVPKISSVPTIENQTIDLNPESEALHQSLKGVPVWVIDARYPGSDKVKKVIDALQDSQEIEDSKPSSEEPVEENLPVLNFLCLQNPPNRTKMFLNPHFSLSLLPNPIISKESSDELDAYDPSPFASDEQTDFESTIEESKISNSSMTKQTFASRESQQKKITSSEEAEPVFSSSSEVTAKNSDGIFKSRWVLQPGEKLFWNIRFQPPALGEYLHPYTLTLVDCNTSYTFEAKGFCDIPKLYLDPYSVFPKVEWAKQGEKFYLPTYFLSKNQLDFGPVLLPKVDENKSYKTPTIETSISLLNCSSLPIECTLFYLDSIHAAERFSFTPSLLHILPGRIEKLSLEASPTHFGKNEETIGLSVKNNPRVELIRLVAYGIASEFEIEPRMVKFEHVLLYRTESRSVTLFNKCLVSLAWKFFDIEDFSECISISETSGVIKPLENKVVVFTYEAKEVQEIVKKPIRVEVYEAEARTYREPVISDEILISAETCDVMVDIKFHHSDDRFVKFGDVKVGTKYVQPMQIINTGKYDLIFRIEPAEIDIEIPDRDKTLWIDPESAVAPTGETPTGVQVYFKPEVKLDLKHALFQCKFYDSYNKNVVVGIVPITVAARSFYSEFRVQPVPDINFGAMLLGTKKEVKLSVENTGQFFFSYTISNTKAIEEKKPKANSRGSSGKSSSSGGKKSSKNSGTPDTKEKAAEEGKNSATAKASKASTKSKGTGKSKKQPTATILQLGPFSIQDPQGALNPGESALLTVTCCTNTKGELEEEIRITISEGNPLNDPCLIKLSAVGSLPFVDFTNIDHIFAEHYICENLAVMDVPDEIESHGVFLKDSSKLKFCRVLIGTYFTARLKLYNSGLVPCDLNVDITEQTEFSVNPSKLTIASLSTEIVSITFSPRQLQMYNAVLRICTEHLQGGNILTVNLEGEGVTPQVTIVSPLVRDSEGRTLLIFRPTAVGHSSCKEVVIKNTGVVACQMIIEMNNNHNGFFTMHSTLDGMPFMADEISMGISRHTTVVNLPLAQSATFIFKFTPGTKSRESIDVRVFVMHNLYENETLLLNAEGYIEDITLDATDDDVLLVDKDDDIDPPTYHINFGKQNVNSMTKRFFKVTNNSETDIYRYEWASNPYIDLCPSVGHIRPLMNKETRIIFIPNLPVKLDKVEISCEVTQITYFHHQSVWSWDDKMLQDLLALAASEEEFERRSTSVGESMGTLLESEPRHRSVNGTKRTIKLTVSGESSYTDFQCSTKEVSFKDTLMFQTVSRSFQLKNISDIYMDYEWMTEEVEFFPVPDPDVALKAEALISMQLLDPVTCTSRPRTFSLDSTQKSGSLDSIESDFGLDTLQRVEHGGFAKIKNPGEKSRPHTAQPHSTLRGIISRPASALTGFLADLSAKDKECRRRTKPSLRMDSEIDVYNPYTLEPPSGRLEPGKTVDIKLSFAPLDVGCYNAKIFCKIPNLPAEHNLLDIVVDGSCLVPMAHFEIGESDYFISGRRHDFLVSADQKNICRELEIDQDTRVLEFNVLGVGTTFSRKFKLINPTNQSYNFLWTTSHTSPTSSVSPFFCVTLKGLVEKGKRLEIEFCFVPPDVGTFESFWTFTILEHSIEIPFLLVGHASHPAVYFNCPYLQLPETIIGVLTESVVSIVSKADSQLEFSIVPNSLYSEGRFQTLKVTPEKGCVAAGGEMEIRISMTPNTSGSASFKLKCIVERVACPLALLVEAVTYRVQPSVFYEPIGQKRISLEHTQSNLLDLGAVTAKYPQTVRIHVVNMGKISFFYKWQYDASLAESKKVQIAMKNECGQVMHETKVVTTLTITLLSKTNLKDFPLSLKITRGPTYHLLLQAMASQPTFTFTFSQYDFGPCFIQQDQKCRNRVKLEFTNNDTTSLILECTFAKKPHLTVIIPKEPIAPKVCVYVIIEFYPLERRNYNETLLFVINGVHQKKVNISGEGIDAMINLVNPRDKLISLGAVHIGKSSRRLVPVVNKSRAPIQVQFNICPLPGSKENNVSLAECLKLVPNTAVVLKPNLAIDLAIKYSPTTRMKPFNAKICMDIVDHNEPLLLVDGSCLGAEFSLNQKYIPFGAVVEGCSLEIKLALVNSGDLGAKFDWKPKEWDLQNFSITPASGYCSPGLEVMFVISFHPEKQQIIIRDDVKCYVENYGCLDLTLTGSCISKPLPKETINFVTPVRQVMKKMLAISNKSSQIWQLTPVLTGDYFSGSDFITVPSQSTANYEITYFPMRMSKMDGKHKGSVFLQLPDGQALIYDLLGTAEAPLGAIKITRTIDVKTHHTEVFSVMNWLPTPQRFHVEKELAKNEKTDRPYEITGANFLDLPGLCVRNYRLGIFLFKEGELNFTITFTNTESGEYQFQELALTAVKRGPLDVIQLTTCVRCPARHDICVKNPLSRNVSFVVISAAPGLTYPAQRTVPARGSEVVTLEYFPLRPDKGVHYLELVSADLGTYPYEIQLSATASPKQKPTSFTAQLGQSFKISIEVQNLAKVSTDFHCLINNEQFMADNILTLAESSQGLLMVTYEPTEIGTLQAELTVTSAEAGEYIFPLIGNCTSPKPQGPFIIWSGSWITIPFKNIFLEEKIFQMRIDNKAFMMTLSSEKFDAKEEKNIVIVMQSQASLEMEETCFPVTGKLVVTCADPALAHMKWTYYLKGVL